MKLFYLKPVLESFKHHKQLDITSFYLIYEPLSKVN